MEKVRHLRNTLNTKIKNAMYFIFGDLLERINNKSTSEEVLNWKKSAKTKKCYEKLFKNIEEGSEDTYMTRILERIWPTGGASNENAAYAIAVCQTMLNPNIKTLAISEKIIQQRVERNLVSV